MGQFQAEPAPSVYVKWAAIATLDDLKPRVYSVSRKVPYRTMNPHAMELLFKVEK